MRSLWCSYSGVHLVVLTVEETGKLPEENLNLVHVVTIRVLPSVMRRALLIDRPKAVKPSPSAWRRRVCISILASLVPDDSPESQVLGFEITS